MEVKTATGRSLIIALCSKNLGTRYQETLYVSRVIYICIVFSRNPLHGPWKFFSSLDCKVTMNVFFVFPAKVTDIRLKGSVMSGWQNAAG